MGWYLGAWQKFAVFEGRARRTEYWIFVLINTIIGFVLGQIDSASGIGVLELLFSLAAFIPGWAVTVRRLHDTNRSGWWLLIGLIPLIGIIVLLVFTLSDSDDYENDYGPNPKAYAA